MIPPNRTLSLLLLATGWALASPAATPFDKAVPENTDLYIELRDWRESEKAWQASPAYKTWQSKDLAPVREWFASKWEEASPFEAEDAKKSPSLAKIKEMSANLKGSAGFAVLDLDRFIVKMAESFGAGMGGGAPAPANGNEEDVSWRRLQQKAQEDEEEFEEEEGTGGIGSTFNPADLPGALVFLQVDGDGASFAKDMETLMGLMAEEQKASEEGEAVEFKPGSSMVDGLEIHHLASVEKAKATTNFFWVVTEGYAVMGNRSELIGQTAANLKKGSAVKPLASHPEYARADARLEKADVMTFLNLTRIMESVEKLMGKSTQPNAMLGFSMAQLGKRMDLTAMLPLTTALKLEPDGIRMISDFGFSRATPLAKLLMPYGREKTEMPGFIPTEAMSANAMRLSPAKWYESLEVFLNSLSPQVGMFLGMARMGVTSQFGVDLKTDLLDHLGDTLVVAEELVIAKEDPAAATPKAAADEDEEEDEEELDDDPLGLGDANRLIAFSLKDKGGLQTTIGKILAKMGESSDLLKKKEYLGQEYFEISGEQQGGPLGGQALAYAFLDGYVVVSMGNPSLLHAAMRTQGKPGTSVWENEDLRREIARGEGAPISVQVARTESMLGEMAKGIAMASGGADLPDFSLLARLFGSSVSVGRFDGQRLSSDGILRYADDAK